jgi:hypothetical protein
MSLKDTDFNAVIAVSSATKHGGFAAPSLQDSFGIFFLANPNFSRDDPAFPASVAILRVRLRRTILRIYLCN